MDAQQQAIKQLMGFSQPVQKGFSQPKLKPDNQYKFNPIFNKVQPIQLVQPNYPGLETMPRVVPTPQPRNTYPNLEHMPIVTPTPAPRNQYPNLETMPRMVNDLNTRPISSNIKQPVNRGYNTMI